MASSHSSNNDNTSKGLLLYFRMVACRRSFEVSCYLSIYFLYKHPLISLTVSEEAVPVEIHSIAAVDLSD